MMTEQGKVLSALLNGQFICQVSDEDSWRFLKSRVLLVYLVFSLAYTFP